MKRFESPNTRAPKEHCRGLLGAGVFSVALLLGLANCGGRAERSNAGSGADAGGYPAAGAFSVLTRPAGGGGSAGTAGLAGAGPGTVACASHPDGSGGSWPTPACEGPPIEDPEFLEPPDPALVVDYDLRSTPVDGLPPWALVPTGSFSILCTH